MADVPVPVLAIRDLETLREMARWFRSSAFNRRSYHEPENDHQAPEVYVAKTHVDGIAALGGDGFDLPGYADCEVYQLLEVDGVPTLSASDRTVRVHNLSDVAVDGDAWALVARDKYGRWYVTAVMSGPGEDARGGPCSNRLAKLFDTDCVQVSDGVGQTVNLLHDAGSGRWKSEDADTGTATEVFHYPTLSDPIGYGHVELWFASGALHLSIDGMELLNCGNGCFMGGSLTGHVGEITTGTGTSNFYAACDGPTFTVCVTCGCEEVGCCPNPPSTLYATISGLPTTEEEGACYIYSYLNGTTAVLTYYDSGFPFSVTVDGSPFQPIGWYGVGTIEGGSGGEMYFVLYCTDGVYSLLQGFGGTDGCVGPPYNHTSKNCYPFLVEFFTSGECAGLFSACQWSVTVTV